MPHLFSGKSLFRLLQLHYFYLYRQLLRNGCRNGWSPKRTGSPLSYTFGDLHHEDSDRPGPFWFIWLHFLVLITGSIGVSWALTRGFRSAVLWEMRPRFAMHYQFYIYLLVWVSGMRSLKRKNTVCTTVLQWFNNFIRWNGFVLCLGRGDIVTITIYI